MSNVKILRVRSRLSKLALRRGGIFAKDAIDRAEKAIDANNGALLAALDQILTDLEERFGAQSLDGSPGDCEGLYAQALRVIDVSICLKDSLIDKAAYALCDLADISAELNVWDRQAVELHIMALRLLRSSGKAMPMARRERLVEGLHKVTAKCVGDVEAIKDAVHGQVSHRS